MRPTIIALLILATWTACGRADDLSVDLPKRAVANLSELPSLDADVIALDGQLQELTSLVAQVQPLVEAKAAPAVAPAGSPVAEKLTVRERIARLVRALRVRLGRLVPCLAPAARETTRQLDDQLGGLNFSLVHIETPKAVEIRIGTVNSTFGVLRHQVDPATCQAADPSRRR